MKQLSRCHLLSARCVRLFQNKDLIETFPFLSNKCRKTGNMRTGIEIVSSCIPEAYSGPCQTFKLNLFAKIINRYKDKFRTLSNIWDETFPASCYRLQRRIQNLSKYLKWSFLRK